MFHPKLFVATALGLAAAACSSPYDRPAPVPYTTAQYVVATGPIGISQQNCLDYGFVAGTTAFDRCVSRDAQARSVGRMTRGYALAQIEADSRAACYSYGLEPGSSRYDRCVGREVDARRFRDEAYVTPVSTTTYVYTPTPSPVVVDPAYDGRIATTGVQTYRDEYGFRYDAQGNRLDANGNIISPHSTRP
jgi:hypothetical protein